MITGRLPTATASPYAVRGAVTLIVCPAVTEGGHCTQKSCPPTLTWNLPPGPTPAGTTTDIVTCASTGTAVCTANCCIGELELVGWFADRVEPCDFRVVKQLGAAAVRRHELGLGRTPNGEAQVAPSRRCGSEQPRLLELKAVQVDFAALVGGDGLQERVRLREWG